MIKTPSLQSHCVGQLIAVGAKLEPLKTKQNKNIMEGACFKELGLKKKKINRFIPSFSVSSHLTSGETQDSQSLWSQGGCSRNDGS